MFVVWYTFYFFSSKLDRFSTQIVVDKVVNLSHNFKSVGVVTVAGLPALMECSVLDSYRLLLVGYANICLCVLLVLAGG